MRTIISFIFILFFISNIYSQEEMYSIEAIKKNQNSLFGPDYWNDIKLNNIIRVLSVFCTRLERFVFGYLQCKSLFLHKPEERGLQYFSGRDSNNQQHSHL